MLLLRQLLLRHLRGRFLNRSYPGTPPFRCRESRPYHEEPRLKTFFSISSCTCSSVFALFTNGHVDLVTGSESSTYWSWAVLRKKKSFSSASTLLVTRQEAHPAWKSLRTSSTLSYSLETFGGGGQTQPGAIFGKYRQKPKVVTEVVASK